ncbi:MAG: cation transporter [Rhodospirillaceae bacterium]|nr:cation transporter [Rhodospirillaceae bacterium]
MRIISLAAFLFAFWLALSGHYTPFLVGVGLASAVLCAIAGRRMLLVDPEGHPLQLLKGVVTYYPWLVWEIVKSAWSVTLIILNPRLPISPTMTRLRATQRSPAGIATYGNSITLTPGTLTVGVTDNELVVHALTLDGALDLESGRMDRRVSRFEGTA